MTICRQSKPCNAVSLANSCPIKIRSSARSSRGGPTGTFSLESDQAWINGCLHHERGNGCGCGRYPASARPRCVRSPRTPCAWPSTSQQFGEQCAQFGGRRPNTRDNRRDVRNRPWAPRHQKARNRRTGIRRLAFTCTLMKNKRGGRPPSWRASGRHQRSGARGTSTEPSTNFTGPSAFGIMSQSKISFGIHSVAHAFGMSTTPDKWPWTGAVPRMP